MLKPAVFLDRDSTLNQRVYDDASGIMASPLLVEHLALRRDAFSFVRVLNGLGYLCLAFTTQPELLSGRLSLVRLDRIHQALRQALLDNGAHLDGIFYRGDAPDPGPLWRAAGDGSARDGSARPNMLVEAAAVHHVDMRRSFVVSDHLADMAAGRTTGAETILLGTDNESIRQELAVNPEARPDHFAADLTTARRIIESSREAALR